MRAEDDDTINQPDIGHPSALRRVTLKQVADRARVSPAAASAALSGRRGTTRVSAETAEVVRRAATELGYEPLTLGRGLAARQSRILALAMPYAAAFWDGNPFNQAIIYGASEAAARRGYNLMLRTQLNHGWQEWDAASLMDAHADGVVVVALATDSPVLRALAAAAYPAVAAVCDPVDCPVSSVNATDFEGARAAVTYLLRLGHRRIAYLMGSEVVATSCTRRDGYQQALQDAGLTVNPHLIAHASSEQAGGFRAAVRVLSQQPRPTALLAFNDLMARGAIEAAHQMGIPVPDQLSVVGFDDAEFAATMQSPLTTVRYPAREIGAQALEALVHILQTGDPSPQSLTVPTQLVVRESCAPPASETSR
jgi:LacI family transcriptional regulator